MLSRTISLVLVLLTITLFHKIDLNSFLLGKIPLWDFDVYYQTAKDVIKGTDPYTVPYMQTAGPPTVIIPYLPFTIFSLPIARSLMITMNVLAAFASCWLLTFQFLTHNSKLIHRLNLTLLLNFLFWLTFLPRYNLNVGQPNILIMLLVTLMLTTDQEKLKGLWLAIIILLKTHYVFTILSISNFTHRTSLIVCIFALVGLGIISQPIIKPQYYLNYLQNRFSTYVLTASPIPDVDYYNQSLRSTLSRLQVAEVYPVVALLLLVFGSVYVIKTADTAGGILLSLLLSPIVWQHYLVAIYPIGFLTLYEYWQRGHVPWYITFACGLILMHLPWLHGQPIERLSGIFASHYYLGILILILARANLFKTPLKLL